ncbi:MAG: TonB-dependent receptor, partial [Sphingomonadales bacterium]
MKISLKRIALGTSALTLLISGSAFAYDVNISGYGRIGLEYPKATNSDGLSSRVRISVDSNICENYNSGTFFLPNISNYDQRMVDDAMADINRLSDTQFLDFMDWLDGAKPPQLVLRDSPLGRAMDTVDWLNDVEVDELFRLTSERDADLFWGEGGPRLSLSFNGIFAQALTPKTPAIESPRYFSPRYAGYTYEPPKISINQELTDADLEAIENFVNGTGGGLTQSETPGKIDAYLPYNRVYGLDRFQIRADYNYSLDNGITDVSSVGGNPDLEEETSDTYTIGAVITPGAIPGLSVAIDYYNIEITDILTPPPELPYNPSEYRFLLRTNMGGGMVSIDPPTLDLDAGPSDEPIESIIPELESSLVEQRESVIPEPESSLVESTKFDVSEWYLEGDIPLISGDSFLEPRGWAPITPHISLIYDIGSGRSLNIPLGKYDQPIESVIP